MFRVRLKWGYGVCLSLMFGSGALHAARPYGLDERPAIGAFLNGQLPATALVQTGKWAVVDAFTNLTVDDPTMLIPEPESNRLYVSTREGRIFSFINEPAASQKVEVLDLTDVTQGWDDCGLLAFAFHPEFNRTDVFKRYIYVWYHYNPMPVPGPDRPPILTPGYNRLSRFTIPRGSLVADRKSEQVLINQFDHNVWHDGSGMTFGPDGFLYLTVSDEGASYDYYNNTQTIRGKMFSGVLRIDVDQDPKRSHPIRRQPRPEPELPKGFTENSYTSNYFIPNDNPFLDPNGGVLEEFYAVGLRNPHRMTLDRVTGRFWIGDVGQDLWEEVDVLERAANFQWAYMEGNHPVPNKKKPDAKDFIGFEKPPVYDYGHSREGNCVIGGYVYRGAQFADELGGKYIFGDNGSGWIWSLTWNGKDKPTVEYLCNMPPGYGYTGLSSFGIDEKNELYMLKMGQGSKIYKIVSRDQLEGASNAKIPNQLSQLHIFTDLAHVTPASGLIGYGVNSPLWSDGALKERWIAVPAGEHIGFSPTNSLSFPSGTVFIKNFALTVNETNGATRRLETRVLVRDANGGVYGMTYKWRPDGSDADLIRSPVTENLAITTAAGVRTQTWYYPGPRDCLVCHNLNGGSVLGVNARQLNGLFTYASTGVTDNQLRTWNHIGLFSSKLSERALAKVPALARVDDTKYPLEYRVRSYLDANCAQCHRPNGAGGYFDARFSTPLAEQKLIDGPLANSMGDDSFRAVVAGDMAKSVLHQRINRVGALQMPPLARNVVDTNAVNAIGEWISSLRSSAVTKN